MSDYQQQLVFVNKAWLKYRGAAMDTEMGNGWTEAVYAEDRFQLEQSLTAAFAGRKLFSAQFRIRKYDATYRWVEMQGSPMFSNLGDFIGYTGTLQDITHIKELQLQLNRQKEILEVSKIEFTKFTKIAQRINVVIVLCDPGYRITWVNDSFVKLTGFPLREVNGKDPLMILSGQDTDSVVVDKLKKTIEQGMYG